MLYIKHFLITLEGAPAKMIVVRGGGVTDLIYYE